MKDNSFTSQRYREFIKLLKELLPGRRVKRNDEEQIKVLENHWNMGQQISEFRKSLIQGERAELNQRIMKALQREKSFIYQLEKFYKIYPRGLPKTRKHPNLTWSHFLEVLPLETERRKFYLDHVKEEGTSRNALRRLIKGQFLNKVQTATPSQPNGILSRSPKSLFVFKAHVKRVIDGDTLELMADQGFNIFHEFKGRLRGLNAPEMSGDTLIAGQKAKDFLQSCIEKCAFVVIRSYQTDKYGRYVIDVFFHPEWDDQNKIYREGFFLNQMLLDEGHAKLAVY